MWNILQGYLELQLWCFQQNCVCLDNLTVTLSCLLASPSCHFPSAPRPLSSRGLLNIGTISVDQWIIISKRKRNPYRYIFISHFLLGNPFQDIGKYSRLNIVQRHEWTVNLSVTFCWKCFSCLLRFVHEVKGTRPRRLFLWESFCVLMCLSTLLLLLWNAWKGAIMINELLIANSVSCILCVISLLTFPSLLFHILQRFCCIRSV